MPEDRSDFFSLSKGSYFSESSYSMSDWADRYWGPANKVKLAQIKLKYDPNQTFSCYHCVSATLLSSIGRFRNILSFAFLMTVTVFNYGY